MLGAMTTPLERVEHDDAFRARCGPRLVLLIAMMVAIGPSCSLPRATSTVSPRSTTPEALTSLDDVQPYRRYTVLVRVRDRPNQKRAAELISFSATDVARGTRRVGWIAFYTFGVDADGALSVEPTGVESAFGVIELPADAQWLGIGVSFDLSALRSAIARYDARQPSLSPASFLPQVRRSSRTATSRA